MRITAVAVDPSHAHLPPTKSDYYSATVVQYHGLARKNKHLIHFDADGMVERVELDAADTSIRVMTRRVSVCRCIKCSGASLPRPWVANT